MVFLKFSNVVFFVRGNWMGGELDGSDFERILPSVRIELRGGYLQSRAPWASPKSVLAAASPNKAIVAKDTAARAALSTVILRIPLIFCPYPHFGFLARTGHSPPFRCPLSVVVRD